MREYESGAYIVSRRGAKRVSRRGGRTRGVAAVFAVLLLITSGIVLAVIFFPRGNRDTPASSKPSFGGKSFYFLAVGKATESDAAGIMAKDASERGGAGYVLNDGSYNIIAAAYEREADAKALSELNENAHYLSVSIPKTECDDGDRAALEALCGVWFPKVYAAATEFDRGNVTEAAADYAAKKAFDELRYAASGADGALKDVLLSSCDYSSSDKGGRSTLSYIRYMTVRTIVNVYSLYV